MIEISVYITFILAVVILQLSPGPDMFLVISQGLGNGWKFALLCVLGFSAAGLIQVPALALGIGAIFQSSVAAYYLLRWCGAAYLLFIGWRAINRSSTAEVGDNKAYVSKLSVFQLGFLNNLLNPKVLIFMLAFLPQFTDPMHGPITTQILILGLTHKLIEFTVNGSVALLSGSAGKWIAQNRQFLKGQQLFIGIVMIMLGLYILIDSFHVLALSPAA